MSHDGTALLVVIEAAQWGHAAILRRMISRRQTLPMRWLQGWIRTGIQVHSVRSHMSSIVSNCRQHAIHLLSSADTRAAMATFGWARWAGRARRLRSLLRGMLVGDTAKDKVEGDSMDEDKTESEVVMIVVVTNSLDQFIAMERRTAQQ
jgi:hypothetical protein